MNWLKRTTIFYRNKIPITTTRLPWLHKNFSGVRGWKQNFIKRLEDGVEFSPEERGKLKVLFKFFGRPIILDSNYIEFWATPKVRTSKNGIQFGWLYWAIIIIRARIYDVPDEIIEKYKDMTNEDILC